MSEQSNPPRPRANSVELCEISRQRLQMVDRGEAGRVLRELKAQDFQFTVLETYRLTSNYQRIRCYGNGFLRTHAPYPTMWVRLWFADPTNSGLGHQRAYTLVDPDVETDTFWLEFALHDGAASEWAKSVTPGAQIEASLYGSEPSLPESETVDLHLLVGDTASLPAINSLLDALSGSPALVILEWVHESDRTLPVRLRASDRIRWIRRGRDGSDLLDGVAEELGFIERAQPAGAPDHSGPMPPSAHPEHVRVFAWGACDTVTTRALTRMLRAAGLPRDRVKTLGYWLPPKTQGDGQGA